MKKLVNFFLLLSIPLITSAKTITNYNVKADFNDYSNVKIQKIIEKSDNEILEEILQNNVDNSKIINSNIVSNMNYSLEEKDSYTKILYREPSNKILLDYEMNLTSSSKDNSYIYPLINEIDEDINNLNIRVTLPKEYAIVELIIDEKPVPKDQIKIENNVLSSKITNLRPSSSVKLKIVKKTNIKISLLTKLSLFFPIVGTIISYLLWYFLGKDHPYKIKKTANIPKNTDFISSAITYNNDLNAQDIKLLLVELLNKEYIYIKSTSKGLKFVKGNKYDGKKYIISLFLRCLFRIKDNEEINGKIKYKYVDEILISDINYDNLVYEINNRVEETKTKEQYFEETSSVNKIYILLIVVMSLLLVCCNPLITYNKILFIPLGTILALITFTILNIIVSKFDFEKLKIVEFAAGYTIIIALIYLLGIKLININRIYLNAYVIGIFCSTLMLVLYKYMPKRTKKGTKIIAQLESLKLFIDTSTKEEINSVIEVNEEYIYEIIPYTYLFNNENILKEKMTTEKITGPKWLKKKEKFTIDEIYDLINSICKI